MRSPADSTQPPEGVVWVCPECCSDDIESYDDPDWQGSELLSVCNSCGHGGADDEFQMVVVNPR